MLPSKPIHRPLNPRFCSGPSTKRPGWALDVLSRTSVGRSHRHPRCSDRLRKTIDYTREILEVPEDYAIGIIPGSDTGAFEAALWTLLGAREVDVLAWESFGHGWAYDINEQLKLNARVLAADYGEMPDLDRVDWERDVVFVWNGTTSGVCLSNSDWIADDRGGLSICDGTSAAFAMELPWGKLDVLTFSWQKCLGGEGAHGMLVLSPRAIARLESYDPPWPLPKLFWRLKANGKLNQKVFEGHTITTPSMLCVEDYLDALAWARAIGGLPALIERSRRNAEVIANWLETQREFDYLAREPEFRSRTSTCIKVVDPAFLARAVDEQRTCITHIVRLLEEERVAYDIGPFHAAPPSLRVWTGPTVEASDLEALTPWLSWALGHAMR